MFSFFFKIRNPFFDFVSNGVDGWFLRPKKLASNESSKVAAIKHAFIEAEKYYKKQFEIIFDLDVTSPLRKTVDIVKAYKLFVKKQGDVLVSGSKSKHNPYFNIVEIVNKRIKKVKDVKKIFFRRQDAPETYDLNASVYIWNRKTLLKSSTAALEKKLKCKTVFYEMPSTRSIDIDSKLDFKLVEFLLKQKNF